MDGTEVAVREIRSVGPDTIALEMETPDGFEAHPGQFIKLHATIDGETYDRFYTLSSQNVDDTFEITISVDPDGDLSPYLAELTPGATVEIAGPFGNSYYENEDTVIILAGGPGIGPAIGIGERTLTDGGNVTIIYRDDQPAHETRLSELAARGATIFIITDDGFNDAVSTALSTTDGQVFIYGFADFLNDALTALETTNYNPENAKTENFG